MIGRKDGLLIITLLLGKNARLGDINISIYPGAVEVVILLIRWKLTASHVVSRRIELSLTGLIYIRNISRGSTHTWTRSVSFLIFQLAGHMLKERNSWYGHSDLTNTCTQNTYTNTHIHTANIPRVFFEKDSFNNTASLQGPNRVEKF